MGETTKAVMMTDAVAPTVNGFAVVAEVSRAEFEDMKIHAQTAIAVAAERIEADCEGQGEDEGENLLSLTCQLRATGYRSIERSVESDGLPFAQAQLRATTCRSLKLS